MNTPEMQELLVMLPTNTGRWHLAYAASDIQSSPADREVMDVTLNELDVRAASLRSGLGVPVYFLSAPISGARAALNRASEVKKAIGVDATFVAVRQVELDAEVPFDWPSIGLSAGEALLVSEPYRELEDLLVDLERVPQGSLLRAGLRLVADSNQTGRCYYIIGPKGLPSDEFNSLRRQLQKHGLDLGVGRSPLSTHRFSDTYLKAAR